MPNPFDPTTLIPAGINLIGNLAGGAVQQKTDMDAWLKQQEYNTPKNQMARYKEAGLNPLLIYGQGSPGNANTAPPTQDIKSPTNAIGTMVQDINLKNQTIDNLKLEAENKDLQNKILTQEDYWRSILLGDKHDTAIASNNIKRIDAEWIPQMREADIAKKSQDVIASKANVAMAQARNPSQIALMNANAKNAVQRTATEVQKTLSQKVSNLNQQRMISHQLELLKSRIANIDQATMTSHTQEILNKANSDLRTLDAGAYDSRLILDGIGKISSSLNNVSNAGKIPPSRHVDQSRHYYK